LWTEQGWNDHARGEVRRDAERDRQDVSHDVRAIDEVEWPQAGADLPRSVACGGQQSTGNKGLSAQDTRRKGREKAAGGRTIALRKRTACGVRRAACGVRRAA